MSASPRPCRICKTDKYLRPRFYSEHGEYWVHCDKCGLVSNAAPIADYIEQWNREQDESILKDAKNERVPGSEG